MSNVIMTAELRSGLVADVLDETNWDTMFRVDLLDRIYAVEIGAVIPDAEVLDTIEHFNPED